MTAPLRPSAKIPVRRGVLWFLIFLIGPACADRHQVGIQIRGSDSEVNLVQRLAEEFMKSHPDVSVAVTGGGSGTGITSLMDKTTDIANSSRPLRPEEKLLSLRKGITPVGTVFAVDALTIIVHEKNPIPALTPFQLKKMFSGEMARWDDLNISGQTGPIVCYGRQSSSGSYVFFRDHIVQSNYAESVRQMSGNAQIVEAVSRDRGAIAYVAVGYLHQEVVKVKAVPIIAADGKPSNALNPQDIMDGRYPIRRPLFQFTDGPPTDQVLDFLRFETSETGSQIAKTMGFYPVPLQWHESNKHLEAAEP